MSELPVYTINRVFDAPREMVWRAWTDPALLNRWYGPGVETVIHRFDLEPGGVWLNEMKWGENSNFQKMQFLDVVTGQKLIWHHISCDADWNTAVNPMMPDWPRILLTTVTFADDGGKTMVSLSQQPHEASEAEIACFAETMAGMDKGWGAGYAILDELFSELQGS